MQDNTSSHRIPKPIDTGRNFESAMSFLYEHYKEHKELIASGSPLATDVAERYACGFPLPPFQRGFCWTQDQQEAFIESCWYELPIGTFTCNGLEWEIDGTAVRYAGWLIDGQQRLTTLQNYWEDKFPVFGLLWSELTPRETRRFNKIGFTHYETDLFDENLIRDLYNKLAFGGTAHTEDQRA